MHTLQCNPKHSDYPDRYDIHFECPETVEEFVSNVMHDSDNPPSLQVVFHLVRDNNWIHQPYCEYYQGKALNVVPPDILPLVVRSAMAYSGYNRMDYYVVTD